MFLKNFLEKEIFFRIFNYKYEYFFLNILKYVILIILDIWKIFDKFLYLFKIIN